jgi:hypothetical protein
MGLVVSIIGSPPAIVVVAVSRGSNLACSGSFESTISVVEVVLLPKRFIFFARATMEERRRSRTDGGGRFESSS